MTDKTGQKTKTEFIWLGEKLLAESSKGHYQSYLYELGTFKPLVLLKGKGKKAEVYYYQLDHLGTPQELTATNGAIAWSAKYKAYGNLALQEQIEGIEQPLRFQEQYHDLETGLYYNRNRYYSPDTGRYITLDPIKLAGGLNSYQYTTNPIDGFDPLGLMELENPNGQLALPAPEQRLALPAPEKKVVVDTGEPVPSKPDFYIGPGGPSDTVPSTAYRYERYLNDDGTINGRGADMLRDGEGKVTYFGFEKYKTGKEA